MLGETIDNISALLNINITIIPNIITFFIVVILIVLSFKMNTSGLLSPVIMIALYTVSMTILTLLGIDSVFNIITLVGELL